MSKRQKPPRDIVDAARQVAAAMRSINAGIEDLAAASGFLTAMADNADQVETLASVRADTGYQLVGALSQAYLDLSDYFTREFQ